MWLDCIYTNVWCEEHPWVHPLGPHALGGTPGACERRFFRRWRTQVEHSITYPPITMPVIESQRDQHVIPGCISCRKISSHRTYADKPIRCFSLVITKKRNSIRNRGGGAVGNQTLRRKLTLIKLTRDFDVITFKCFGKVGRNEWVFFFF